MASKVSIGDDLPSDENTWTVWAARYNVSGSTIHDATLTSASTISERQYLLLQVLWTSKASRKLSLKQVELETWKREADKLLATFQSWASYRQSFASGPILEGTFALAKKYQLQAAASREESFQSNVAFSPISNRTRTKMGRLEQKLREAQLETPTKSTGKLPSEMRVEDTPETGNSPFPTPGPEEIAHLMYPQTKDEQIVNTALVDFLNALSMHFPQASDWTLHRKSFKAEFQHASFEARTDGYLEDGGSSERVRALIEVKPMIRRKKLNLIRMQEAAQMAAWIKSDPDPTGVLNLPGRRLHVSQDRHQIFITFAEYDATYFQYLDNTLPPSSPRPFLKMHEFGPWNTEVRKDMESVGSILLAIALRAYSDAHLSKSIIDGQKSGRV
ncbi:hypothetical protein BDV28DRAFT_141318 [Aspergillus coremiiformis]|uniref:Uncharacterized protein n=1 Tax=Aspergillus coremiiformis TaxID=138285 RepID=A0A5N6YXL4_9EURO|nr:hypothetical protein BDV28DRAFT_141318 [Aspergillus coremiiformis]